MDKEQLKKISKMFLLYCVITPICFIWDMFYAGMKLLMKGLEKVDMYGNNLLDNVNAWMKR